MIGYLRGTVIARDGENLLLDVNGVGYRLYVPTSLVADGAVVGGELAVHTHLHVRENEVALYAFADPEQLALFEALITVNGVGPKVALAALAAYTPEALALAISTDDIALLSSIAGVGKKTAQRIAIDLKGKVAPELGDGATALRSGDAPALSDAHAALDAMGFSSAEIQVALKGIDMSQDTPAIIGAALRQLGGARA